MAAALPLVTRPALRLEAAIARPPAPAPARAAA
jgi:hypothetical protein